MAAVFVPIDLTCGNINCITVNPSSACITNVMIVSSAGVYASKLQHEYLKEFAQDFTTTAVAERRMIHEVRGATATVLGFNVGATTAAIGGATAVFDLYKNGSSILTGTITLTSGTAAFISVAGTLGAGAACVQGDLLEANIVSVASGGGTLAKGLFTQMTIIEDYATT